MAAGFCFAPLDPFSHRHRAADLQRRASDRAAVPGERPAAAYMGRVGLEEAAESGRVSDRAAVPGEHPAALYTACVGLESRGAGAACIYPHRERAQNSPATLAASCAAQRGGGVAV